LARFVRTGSASRRITPIQASRSPRAFDASLWLALCALAVAKAPTAPCGVKELPSIHSRHSLWSAILTPIPSVKKRRGGLSAVYK
jgi:hypothetical protein